LAQLKMVGPHIDFGGGVTFQLFHHGDTLRAVKDQDGFEIDIDPPLPPNHPYQQHRQPHDPPVRSNIDYLLTEGWVQLAPLPWDSSSVSSFVKSIVINHFKKTHQASSTDRAIDRHVDSNRLLNLLTQCPHTPVEGCTTTTSARFAAGLSSRNLVLTNARHSFVAWITVMHDGNSHTVQVWVMTSESAVCGVGDAFKDRFPQTTRLARVVLGAIISAILFDR